MITTVTLNVSVDKAYVLDDFQKGKVQRVRRCTNTAGGKGLNVAKVIRLCGEEVLATGFTGGFNGAYVEHMLDQAGVRHQFIHTEAETRSCINILTSDQKSTEFLEPGEELDEKNGAVFVDTFSSLVKKSTIVTISGSVPRGIPKDIYVELIRKAKEQGLRVILDTSGEPLKAAIKAGPTMIKPNQDEIEELLGIKISSRSELIEQAKKLLEWEIPYIVISMGAEGALLITAGRVYHAVPEPLDIVNTVGCGDAMTGAFAVALERGYDDEECLRYAVAVSAANTLTMETGFFKEDEMEEIRKGVKVSRV